MKKLWSLPLPLRRPRARARVSPFDKVDFAIVDLETTGWAPEEAMITEIGAVRRVKVETRVSEAVES